MRTTILLTLCLLAGLFLAGTASADTVTVGNCSPDGNCAAVCVDLRTPCYEGRLACVGISFEVPICTPQVPPII